MWYVPSIGEQGRLQVKMCKEINGGGYFNGNI
jgi:hypothetical protein